MNRDNVSEEEAREVIYKIDAERVKWSLYLYGIDTKSSELYDIVETAVEEEEKIDKEQEIITKTSSNEIPSKLGRNEPCYCGSGKKYKKCCLK